MIIFLFGLEWLRFWKIDRFVRIAGLTMLFSGSCPWRSILHICFCFAVDEFRILGIRGWWLRSSRFIFFTEILLFRTSFVQKKLSLCLGMNFSQLNFLFGTFRCILFWIYYLLLDYWLEWHFKKVSATGTTHIMIDFLIILAISNSLIIVPQLAILSLSCDRTNWSLFVDVGL